MSLTRAAGRSKRPPFHVSTMGCEPAPIPRQNRPGAISWRPAALTASVAGPRVYTFAMAVHFLIVDHSLSEEHGRAYGSRGRWLLAASVIIGWIIGVVTPLSEVVVARLFAVLAGGVVITSLRAELPDDREGRFWPFCIGAVIFAGFLILA